MQQGKFHGFFTVKMGQRLFISKNCGNILEGILQELKVSNILVIHGKSSYCKCGAQDIIENLKIQKSYFFDFEENPKEKDVKRGLKLIANDIDAIIGIGGGSVMDMAKLLRFFHYYKNDEDHYLKIPGTLPLIAIPTTAGTGAEATQFAVMYRGNIKNSIDHPAILPDVAIVDSTLTYNNPRYLSACTAFDAFAQAIESFWNRHATKQSDRYAIKALQLIYPSILDLVYNPNNQMRDNLSLGSYWAGKAINLTRTTGPHAFSYPFTSFYGYPHGHAVALTFPQFAEINIEAIGKKGDILLDLLKCPRKCIRDFFIDLINKLGLSCREDENIDKDLIMHNINLQRLSNNPVEITSALATEILDNL